MTDSILILSSELISLFILQHTRFNTRTLQDLEHDLRHNLKPTPSFIMRKASLTNDSFSHLEHGVEEDGDFNSFAIYYSYDDLQAIGKLSSDTSKPWKRIVENVLTLAREYKQAYILVWYPHAFGAPPASSSSTSRHLLSTDGSEKKLSVIDAIPAVKQAKLVNAMQRLPPRVTTKPPPPLPKTSVSTSSNNYYNSQDSSHANNDGKYFSTRIILASTLL